MSWWVAAVLLLLAACAAPRQQTSVDHNPKMGIIAPELGLPCVPPGMPPLAEWRPVGAEASILADTDGRLRLAIRAGYFVKGTPVYGWWVGGALAVVDPDAKNPDTPTWYDAGLVSPDSTLRPGGGPTCDWKRGAGQTALGGGGVVR